MRASAPSRRVGRAAPSSHDGVRGVEHLLGRHEQAHARLVRAFEGLADADSAEAATLMIELAMDGFFRMDDERCTAGPSGPEILHEPLGDRPLTAAAAAVAHVRHRGRRRHRRGANPPLGGGRAVAAMDDAELAARLDAATHLAGAELYLDRYADAADHANRARSVARTTGQSEFIPLANSILGQAMLLGGTCPKLASCWTTPSRPPPVGQRPGAGREPHQPLAHRARRWGPQGGARHGGRERRPDGRAGPEPGVRGRSGARLSPARERRHLAGSRLPRRGFGRRPAPTDTRRVAAPGRSSC